MPFNLLFTNQITGRIAAGAAETTAVLDSMHFLEIGEMLCVALGMVAVIFLSKYKAVKEY